MHSFGQETLAKPTLPHVDLAELRLDLIQEEVDELAQAVIDQDIVEIADALTDILYVTYGAGHAFGIDLDTCFTEVHRSNMSYLSTRWQSIKRSRIYSSSACQNHSSKNTRRSSMIGDHFKTINEENRFTMAVNGYSLYISGTDHDDRWDSLTFVYEDKIDFMAAIASLEDIDVE